MGWSHSGLASGLAKPTGGNESHHVKLSLRSGSAQEILGQIANDAGRQILAATQHESLSVDEIAERCEIPISTVYRRVNELVDIGLLTEQIRLNPSGRHASEFLFRFQDVRIDIEDNAIMLAVPRSEAEERSERRVSVRASAPGRPATDGGESIEELDDGQRFRRLSRIFEEMSGTTKVVDEQQPPARRFDYGEEARLAEYLTNHAKNDGLSEALTDPDLRGG